MNNLEDQEILDTKIGETTIRGMTSLGFLQFVAKKLNGAATYTAVTQELALLVSHPPLSNAMSDEQKVILWRKLQSLNIKLP